MNLLILEDSEERIAKFSSKFGSKHNLTFVMTASGCIEKLTSQDWDYLFLDHDLGDDTLHGTGSLVSRFLHDNPSYIPTRVVLHSSNPVGVERMKKDLPEAQVDPKIYL